MEVINSSLSAEGKQSRRAALKKALFRHFRSARSHHKNKSSRSNLMLKAEAIAKASGQEGINVLSQSTQENNGVVRMKIMVRKEDLEQVLELMRNTNNNANQSNKDNCTCVDEGEEEASLLIEKRLNLLRKKHRRPNSWSPGLLTIPDCADEDEEAATTKEKHLNLLRKTHRRHNSWSPGLQTIPEEILA